jgi:predicted metal-binding membrane protein
MALLFVGGVMNVLWIAALSIWVLLEKIVPAGRVMSRVAGLVLATAGVIFVYER